MDIFALGGGDEFRVGCMFELMVFMLHVTREDDKRGLAKTSLDDNITLSSISLQTEKV